MSDRTDYNGSVFSPEVKKRALYERQKETLEMFLQHGAISRTQYEKSLHDLTEKMGYAAERQN